MRFDLKSWVALLAIKGSAFHLYLKKNLNIFQKNLREIWDARLASSFPALPSHTHERGSAELPRYSSNIIKQF